MEQSHVNALVRAIGPDRFAAYLTSAGGDQDLACRLYVWDRDVAAALLADIAIAEVALRNAINTRLTAKHGADWYTREIGLDARCRANLTTAWYRLSKNERKKPTPQTPGRVVAHLMFGFWTDLLDAGGEISTAPQSFKADYEQMWRTTLVGAFPGGRTEAGMLGEQFTRSWTHSVAATVQAVRNRCAHHEPLLRDIPLPGQARRISAQAGYEANMLLVRMIDRDLAAWLDETSTVLDVLNQRPVY